MVPKDVLLDLFDEKVKKTLSVIEDNKVNIEDYIKNVELWFVEYKKDEIDKAGFQRLLNHIDKETNILLDAIKSEIKPQIIDTLNSFFEQIEEHVSDEIIEQIESVIKSIGGDVSSIKRFRKQNKIHSKWRIPLFVIIVILVLGGGIYYMQNYSANSIFSNDNEINSSTDSNNLNQNLSEQDTKSNNVNDSQMQQDSGTLDFQDSDSKAVLTSLERQVFNLINTQRESYYVPKLHLDENYTKMLKAGESDIASKLEIETFIYEVDEELSLKGDDIALAIFNQMNKRNLFDEELQYVAIKIEKKAYKIYKVKLAYY